MIRLSPMGADPLFGLLYAKHRKLLDVKRFRAGVKLVRIGLLWPSTIGAVMYASR